LVYDADSRNPWLDTDNLANQIYTVSSTHS